MNLIVRDAVLGAYKLLRPYVRSKTATMVADVMTKAVVTLNPHDNFIEAVDLMTERDFRHLVVADDEHKVLGIISDRDILSAKGHISDWRVKQVHQIMTPNPIAVTADTLLSIAVSTMVKNKINCLPVVKGDGTVCGIITSTDVMKFCEEMLKGMEKETPR